MVMTEIRLLNLEVIIKLVNKIALYLNLQSNFNIRIIFKMSHWTLEEEMTPVMVKLQTYWALKSSNLLWRNWISESLSEFPMVTQVGYSFFIHPFIHSSFTPQTFIVYLVYARTFRLHNFKKISKKFII